MSLYRTGVLLMLLTSASVGAAQVESYPSRPLRIITATPGGGNDFLARIIAPTLGEALGQQVIVDNRVSRLVGGLGARATPDGYTTVIGGGTMQAQPLLEKTDYYVIRDFAPVAQLERSPNVLVVNPAILKVNNVQELIALARTQRLNYGTGGTGGSLHIAAELFQLATKTEMKRIAYKSTGPALLGLLTKEVHLIFATAGGAIGHVEAGRLKALGVTSAQPSPLLPQLPTIASQGLPGFDVDTIGFILAPLKTPRDRIMILNKHIVRIMNQPDVKAKLAAGGSESVTGTPEELMAKLKADDARLRKIFKHLGLMK